MVSAQDFLTAFGGQWADDLEHHEQALLDAIAGAPTWTAYMLKGERAFLKRVADRLHRAMVVERDRIDASYYETQDMPDFYPNWWQPYPARWDVLIEHENGEYPQEELYKLLMRRAPLKVVVFYDWGEFAKECHLKRQRWFPETLEDLFRIGRTVATHWPEAENTEYLLLVGQPEQEGGPYRWRYLCVQGGCWPEQPGQLRPL